MLAIIFLTILVLACAMIAVGFAWNRDYDFFLMIGSVLLMVLAILWFADGIHFVTGQVRGYKYSCGQYFDGDLLFNSSNCDENSTIQLMNETRNNTYTNFKDYNVANSAVTVGWMLPFCLFFLGVWVFFQYFLIRMHTKKNILGDSIQGEDVIEDDDDD